MKNEQRKIRVTINFSFMCSPVRLSEDLPFQFRCPARHRETAFDETGRPGVGSTGKAGLLPADSNLEITRLDDCSAIICNYCQLTRLNGELDNAALTLLQMYPLDSRERSNRNPDRCIHV